MRAESRCIKSVLLILFLDSVISFANSCKLVQVEIELEVVKSGSQVEVDDWRAPLVIVLTRTKQLDRLRTSHWSHPVTLGPCSKIAGEWL
jgi:hypothetical protein